MSAAPLLQTEHLTKHYRVGSALRGRSRMSAVDDV